MQIQKAILKTNTDRKPALQLKDIPNFYSNSRYHQALVQTPLNLKEDREPKNTKKINLPLRNDK
jgi:hypothetical protein